MLGNSPRPVNTYASYVVIAAAWIYLLIFVPWMRIIALATAAALVIGALAIWIAKKGAENLRR